GQLDKKLSRKLLFFQTVEIYYGVSRLRKGWSTIFTSCHLLILLLIRISTHHWPYARLGPRDRQERVQGRISLLIQMYSHHALHTQAGDRVAGTGSRTMMMAGTGG
ncbi:MAG: hypothetical protein AN484_27150, partial [Aphanizomenon flos-aquae WA102]